MRSNNESQNNMKEGEQHRNIMVEGSGKKAMSENESAMQKVEKELAELNHKVANGEDIDIGRVNQLKALAEKYRNDQELIRQADK